MEVPNALLNLVLDYLLRQADTGDQEAEALLDELNELNIPIQAKELTSR